jgi:DNA-binding MarR family transcriptional regulator/predicted GNAT family acetyltransferase
MPSDTATPEDIARVRRFTRFYTARLGVLQEGLLDSSFSLTEARLLYELAHRNRPTAAEIARDLSLDQAYLSRLLKRFEQRGLVLRERSAADARQAHLSLTEAGRAAFAPLDERSRDQVATLLSRLGAPDRQSLVKALGTVEVLLGPAPTQGAPFSLRFHRAGDLGWIVHRHGALYAEEYGWDSTFEALVAEIAAGFIKTYDPARERCWIAERNGAIAGSVMLVRQSDEVAKLRLLYVEPWARGLGIGKRLVDECIAFAREAGYRRITLWTNDVLHAARRLYVAAEFTPVAREPHRSFGHDLVGETWQLDL